MEDHEKSVEAQDVAASMTSDPLSYGKEEIFTLESLDPALNAKMHLVNNVRGQCHAFLFYAINKAVSLLVSKIYSTVGFIEFAIICLCREVFWRLIHRK